MIHVFTLCSPSSNDSMHVFPCCHHSSSLFISFLLMICWDKGILALHSLVYNMRFYSSNNSFLKAVLMYSFFLKFHLLFHIICNFLAMSNISCHFLSFSFFFLWLFWWVIRFEGSFSRLIYEWWFFSFCCGLLFWKL